MNEVGHQMKDLATRALAVFGFLAILVLGLWGTVQVVQYAPNLFSSLAAVTTSLTSVFVPNERIVINTPTAAIPSDEVLSLSFDHRAKRSAEGRYVFSYACRDGFSFQSSADGGLYTRVSCGSAFSFDGSQGTIALIPLSEKNRFVDVPISIAFVRKDSGEQTAKGEATLTIINSRVSDGSSQGGSTGGSGNLGTGGVGLTPGQGTSGQYPIGGSTVYDPNGRPDLTPHILQTGYFSTTTNEFVASTTIPFGASRGAVRFEVVNVGTQGSVQWTFNAVLPTSPLHIFHSTMQQALLPGERIEFTLGFDQVNPSSSEGVITINVDPTGSVKELSEQNNIVHTTIKIVR